MSRIHRRSSQTLLLLLLLTSTVRVAHADPLVWYASRSAEARTNWLYGRDACRPGSRDCNPCAPDVEGQFHWALNGGHAQGRWDYEWNRRYPPEATSTDHVFDQGIEKHVQGFVRTQHPLYRYAMAHSNEGSYGGLALVRVENAGGPRLAAIHRTADEHSSPLAPFGRRVLAADLGLEDGDRSRRYLRFVDLDRAMEVHRAAFEVPPIRYGLASPVSFGENGFAMAALRGGGYVVVATEKWRPFPGDYYRPHYVNVYYLEDDRVRDEVPGVGEARRFEHLGWSYVVPRDDDTRTTGVTPVWGAHSSENMQLVTECDTGRIFAIHSGGEDGVSGRNGTGWWRLSELVWRDTDEPLPEGERAYGPVLAPRAIHYQPQNTGDCSMRSAASVSVDDHGVMHFLCHERSNIRGLGLRGDEYRFVDRTAGLCADPALEPWLSPSC